MYLLNGRQFQEDPDAKLGMGTEGIIYPDVQDNHFCIKLFHEPDKTRARKIKAFCEAKFPFPKRIVQPLTPVFDASNMIIGFQMLRLSKKSFKIKEIFDRIFCANNGINTKDITLLFLKLWEDLTSIIHDNNCGVCDVNHGGIMVTPNMKHAWVDVDSWEIPGFQSMALTEIYAHPELYENLLNTGSFIKPQKHHDYFALTVLMVRSILGGLHPFKLGRHKIHKGLQSRAKNGVTVFDGDVSYPKRSLSPDILPDDMLSAIVAILKRQNKASFPLDILRSYTEGIVKCQNCEMEYSIKRSQCPVCSKKTVITYEKFVKMVFQALGPVLHYQLVEDKMWFVTLERGKITLYAFGADEKVVTIKTGITHQRGAQYSIFRDKLVICADPYSDPPVKLQLFTVSDSGITPFDTTTTEALEGSSAVHATSGRFLYRSAQNALKCCHIFGSKSLLEEHVAQMHQTQSWFTADNMSGSNHECVFGYHRALKELTWFIIHGTSDGNSFSYHDIKFPSLRRHESMKDFAVYFSSDAVLLVRKTEYRGREYIRYSVIGFNGQIIQDKIVEDEHFDKWENMHGKIFHKGIVMQATDNGIIKLTLSTNTYEIIDKTENDVSDDDILMRLGSMLVVIRSNMVFTISKSR